CTHQVEVLSRGQQIVVHGIHPDTHAPYTWRDAEPGRDLKLGALPLLSAEKANEFITAAAQCMAAQDAQEETQRRRCWRLFRHPKTHDRTRTALRGRRAGRLRGRARAGTKWRTQ